MWRIFRLTALFILTINYAFLVKGVTFNRGYTGVKFSPYVKATEAGTTFPSFSSYSFDNIKTMLEVVSTKFSKVITYTIGSSELSYNSRVTYDSSEPIAKVAEAAATINKERQRKSLTVFIGVRVQEGKRNLEYDLNSALELAQRANRIYGGTVERIVITGVNPTTSSNLQTTYNAISNFRNRISNAGLKIGTQQPCDKAWSQDLPQNYYGNDRLRYRKSIIEQTNFVICTIQPETENPKESADDVISQALRHQTTIEPFKIQFEVMIETYWPSKGNDPWYHSEKLETYWTEIDSLAAQNNVRVWLTEAFDNPWRSKEGRNQEYLGWWKLSSNEQINSVSGYVEKIFESFVPVDPSRASFGEHCNRTTRCNSRASLACTNGTCQCVKESEMTFDIKRGRCVVLSGERCSYTAIEISMNQTEEKRYSERLVCVENATCGGDGYCSCRKDSFETTDGLCAFKKGYNLTCSKDDECQEKINLICGEGKCVCNGTEAIYDNDHGQCVGKVGASCTKYGKGVKNSWLCPSGDIDQSIFCDYGYVPSEDGFCLGSWGTRCHPISSPCSEEFTCNDGNCTCHFPTQQKFFRENGKCSSYINGPCLETVRGRTFQYPCIGQAECRKDRGIPECLCKNGYIKSLDGNCMKVFGSTCLRDIECDHVPGAMLICSEGFCSCGDFRIYNETSSMCMGLVGAKCNKKDNFCIANASCEIDRGQTDHGFCRCMNGFKVDSNRKCIEISDGENEYAADEGNENVVIDVQASL